MVHFSLMMFECLLSQERLSVNQREDIPHGMSSVYISFISGELLDSFSL